MLRRTLPVWLIVFSGYAFGATFGTVVPIRGTVSDLALDESRGRLYIANLAGYQINIMKTSDRSFAVPLSVPKPPTTLALSPDSRYLVVGEDAANLPGNSGGGLTIFDLNAGTQRQIDLPNPVLAVAFGSGNQAFVVTGSSLLLVTPITGSTQVLSVSVGAGGSPACLPVPFATFPSQIVQADVGVSGDGNTIIALLSIASSPCGASTSGTSGVTIIRYQVGTSTASIVAYTTAPVLGPRAVSVDQYGQNYLAGWALLDALGTLSAQFPYPTGVLNIGSHAWDSIHNRIFAQIPATGDGAVLHVVDTDNLAVRERIQLAENLAGHSTWSSDGSTLYSASISGVTIFPMGSFDKSPRVGAQQEDVVFQGNACDRTLLTQSITVADAGGGNVDFSLSLPANTGGITLTPSSGTTPADVRITVDPLVYQGNKGTTIIPLTITSKGAINLPPTVRLVILTPDVNQHGRVIDVPGKITDIMADPQRRRMYLMRQDKNLILVYDTTTFQQISALRTGNTPVGMAMSPDWQYLIVGSDNSQIDNVYNLDTLQPVARVTLPPGTYGRSVASTGDGKIFQIVRSITGDSTLGCPPPGCVLSLDLNTHTATAPKTLGIYTNSLSTPDGILVASPSFNELLMALADGTVVEYDANFSQWVASRKDFTGLGGAAGAFNDNLFLVDNHILNNALVSIADLEKTSGTSSSIGVAGGLGLRTTESVTSGPGNLERVDLTLLQASPVTLTNEAPLTPTLLKTPTIGQIGQTVLSFSRTLAIPSDRSSIVLASVSGMTVVENSFDAPTPVPTISKVTNVADSSDAVAPGGLVNISGSGLAGFGASATRLPLPGTLGNTCVSIGGSALPLINVSPNSITAQLPFTPAGKAPLVVRTAGGISNPFSVNVQSFAPAVFHTGQAGTDTGLAAITRSTNNELVTFTNPIHPDEMITIYLTGLAQTSPQPALGDAAPANPLALVSTTPTVTLGGLNLPVTFAGLVPGEVGVYQIDAYVPKGLKDSPAAPLTITQGSAVTTYPVRTVNP